MKIIDKLKAAFNWNTETVAWIPGALLFLALVIWVCSLWVGKITEDVTTIVKYAINAFGVVLAGGLTVLIHARAFGDTNDESSQWWRCVLHYVSWMLTLALFLLGVFGRSLWL
jgi:hypothetical protein